MATHSSTLAWKIPWMEKPGRLQSMGSHRVGHTERLHLMANDTDSFVCLFSISVSCWCNVSSCLLSFFLIGFF